MNTLKMARGLKLQIKKVEGLYYLCSKTKGTDQLVCTFVFANAKSGFLMTPLKFKQISLAGKKFIMKNAYKQLRQNGK